MKVLRLLFVGFCLLVSNFVNSQISYESYYKFIREARRHEIKKEIDSALVCYLLAFENVDYVHESRLKAALKLSKKLKRSELTDSLKLQIKRQASNINLEYAKKIKELYKLDQAVRGPKQLKIRDRYISCLVSKDCDSVVFQKDKQIMNNWMKTDSINVTSLLKMINIIGFPGERIVGRRAAEDAFYILLHFDKDTSSLILGALLDSALTKGDISPRNYAQIADRRALMSGRDPVYFSIPIGVEKLNDIERELIDKKRESIFLGKMKETQIIIKTKRYYQVRVID